MGVHVTRNETEERRAEVSRRTEELPRWAKKLRPDECLAWIPEDIGVRIGISSRRAEELFRELERTVFRGFEAHFRERREGTLWARFGYVDWEAVLKGIPRGSE